MMQYKKIHFIGIGGIGMSALARYFHFHGQRVSGSSDVMSDICQALVSEGIEVVVPQIAQNISDEVDCVVYTLAIQKDNPEFVEAVRRGLPMFTYAQMLGRVSEQSFTIAIAGTHGKTTTTGMVASVLRGADRSPNVIVGSLMVEGKSNFIPGREKIFVVEACEYKRSFLNLHPNILVITNLEEDHLDYYRDLADIQDAFLELAEKLPADGKIVCDPSLPNLAPIVAKFPEKIVDYTKMFGRVPEMIVFGAHNVKNGAAALAVAEVMGLDFTKASTGLANFRGTWRRLEFKKVLSNGATLYDDYGHHPTEIQATLNALNEKFHDKKIAVIFQPHLYSRTKTFLTEFAQVLSDGADFVGTFPIYPAREIDDGTISSDMLAEEIIKRGGEAKFLKDDGAAVDCVATLNSEWVVLLLGAGDLYLVAEKL